MEITVFHLTDRLQIVLDTDILSLMLCSVASWALIQYKDVVLPV